MGLQGPMLSEASLTSSPATFLSREVLAKIFPITELMQRSALLLGRTSVPLGFPVTGVFSSFKSQLTLNLLS